MTLYTFFAARPTGQFRHTPDPADVASLAAIRAVVEKPGAGHVFVPVSTVNAIAFWFIDHKVKVTPADRMQIIGHGVPGVLQLGSLWTGQPTNDEETQIYSLNSNSLYYGMLADHVLPGSTVDLIGCCVGNDKHGSDDGATLLFDLARMWGGTVRGSAWSVGPDDFSPADGQFTSEHTLVSAADRSVSPVPPEPTKNFVGDLVKLDCAAIDSTRELGTVVGERRKRMATVTRDLLSDLEVGPVAAAPILGSTEVVGVLDDGTHVSFLSNGVRLRIGERYFAAEDTHLVQRALHALLTS